MARDLNIGIPTTVNMTKPVNVQNFDSVVAAINEAKNALDEVKVELEKITLGTGLVTGTDLNEEGDNGS
jgi:hypothetical protein